MQKQQKRAHFEKKQHYQKRQKQSRKELAQNATQIKEIVQNFQLKDIIHFIHEEYDEYVAKTPQLQSALGSAIIGRVQQLKKAWISYHRQRFFNFLQKVDIPFPDDPNKTFMEKVMSMRKAGCYATTKGDFSRADQSKSCLRFTQLMIFYYKQHFKIPYFYLQELPPEIDFKIDFKRIKKDTLYLCQNFDELVTDVQNFLEEKWQPK